MYQGTEGEEIHRAGQGLRRNVPGNRRRGNTQGWSRPEEKCTREMKERKYTGWPRPEEKCTRELKERKYTGWPRPEEKCTRELKERKYTGLVKA
nr:hypothetical protein BgiMline_015687 [Biomphalaria glabrata]